MDDFHNDRDLWMKLWGCHYHPEEKAAFGSQLAKYQDKLDRCQRLKDKRKQIEEEIEANRLKLFRSFGYSGPDFADFVDPKEITEEATKKRVKEIQDWIDARKRGEGHGEEDQGVLRGQ